MNLRWKWTEFKVDKSKLKNSLQPSISRGPLDSSYKCTRKSEEIASYSKEDQFFSQLHLQCKVKQIATESRNWLGLLRVRFAAALLPIRYQYEPLNRNRPEWTGYAARKSNAKLISSMLVAHSFSVTWESGTYKELESWIITTLNELSCITTILLLSCNFNTVTETMRSTSDQRKVVNGSMDHLARRTDRGHCFW